MGKAHEDFQSLIPSAHIKNKNLSMVSHACNPRTGVGHWRQVGVPGDPWTGSLAYSPHFRPIKALSFKTKVDDS